MSFLSLCWLLDSLSSMFFLPKEYKVLAVISPVSEKIPSCSSECVYTATDQSCTKLRKTCDENTKKYCVLSCKSVSTVEKVKNMFFQFQCKCTQKAHHNILPIKLYNTLQPTATHIIDAKNQFKRE